MPVVLVAKHLVRSLAKSDWDQCNVFTSRWSALNRSTTAHSSSVISAAAARASPWGASRPSFSSNFAEKLSGDSEFPIFRVRHAAGTELVDQEFRH
jgi:hypothetical protein